jgi:hypothetical protein
MIDIFWNRQDRRFTFNWYTEEQEGNDGPITEQLYALLMGWA